MPNPPGSPTRRACSADVGTCNLWRAVTDIGQWEQEVKGIIMVKRDTLLICAVVAISVLAGVPKPVRAMADEELKAIPFMDVTVTGPFWRARLETNRKVTIPYNFKKCDELGLIDNFARAAGFMPADTFQSNRNNRPSRECDVYKTIEGASYVLAKHPDVVLDLYLDSLIAQIAAAQEPDGYL